MIHLSQEEIYSLFIEAADLEKELELEEPDKLTLKEFQRKVYTSMAIKIWMKVGFVISRQQKVYVEEGIWNKRNIVLMTDQLPSAALIKFIISNCAFS